MPIKLGVVGIATRDMAASLAFYRLLGLPLPEGQPLEPHVELALGGVRLCWDSVELLREVYHGWEEPRGHRIELAFECSSPDEVDQLYERVVAGGYEGHREPWDAFWGQGYAVLRDPDGNLISLYAAL